MNDYWFYRWMSAYGARTPSDVARLLKSREKTEELRVEACTDAERIHDEAPAESIVAGTGFDFSQFLDCASPICRRRQVEEQFGRAWHYFDRVVLSDAIGDIIRFDEHFARNKDFMGQVQLHAEALLFLRDIGADEMITFRQKPRIRLIMPGELPPAQEAAVTRTFYLPLEYEELLHEFAEHTHIVLRTRAKFSKATIAHPDIPLRITNYADPTDLAGMTQDQKKLFFAKLELRTQLEYIASDIATTTTYRSPLAIGYPLQARLMTAFSRRDKTEPTLPDIVMRLNLPVITGVSLPDFLRLKQDNRDAFVRFSRRLRVAVQERIKTTGNADAEKLAAEITRDLIEPELHTIKQRLESSSAVLRRKATYSVALGALATTCGLVAGIPGLLAGGALTSIASAVAAQGKYVEEQRDVALSDMYFLWKASHLHR